ncbi:hypothetical protein LX87_05468 [Larkinella arboricola]|uniref:Uncharacterized protein n=1 Tax=Larkinella arboricola TaxID=643671 RepID=A0A327WQU4_LARAB|nr:hypothetical protein [Larkinella arboricola]RAJ90839.1 hypothetical protein LX87_05468 [Larkinella arboricola]
MITSDSAGTTTQFQLRGTLHEGAHKGKTVYLDFLIGQLHITAPGQLLALKGRTFVLDGKQNYAVLEDYDGAYSQNNRMITRYTGGMGELQIKYVRELTHMTVNASGYSYHPCIISGSFTTTIPAGSTQLEILQGRFDFIYP